MKWIDLGLIMRARDSIRFSQSYSRAKDLGLAIFLAPPNLIPKYLKKKIKLSFKINSKFQKFATELKTMEGIHAT